MNANLICYEIVIFFHLYIIHIVFSARSNRGNSMISAYPILCTILIKLIITYMKMSNYPNCKTAILFIDRKKLILRNSRFMILCIIFMTFSRIINTSNLTMVLESLKIHRNPCKTTFSIFYHF